MPVKAKTFLEGEQDLRMNTIAWSDFSYIYFDRIYSSRSFTIQKDHKMNFTVLFF